MLSSKLENDGQVVRLLRQTWASVQAAAFGDATKQRVSASDDHLAMPYNTEHGKANLYKRIEPKSVDPAPWDRRFTSALFAQARDQLSVNVRLDCATREIPTEATLLAVSLGRE